jgi:hypothetical protein
MPSGATTNPDYAYNAQGRNLTLNPQGMNNGEIGRPYDPNEFRSMTGLGGGQMMTNRYTPGTGLGWNGRGGGLMDQANVDYLNNLQMQAGGEFRLRDQQQVRNLSPQQLAADSGTWHADPASAQWSPTQVRPMQSGQSGMRAGADDFSLRIPGNTGPRPNSLAPVNPDGSPQIQGTPMPQQPAMYSPEWNAAYMQGGSGH